MISSYNPFVERESKITDIAPPPDLSRINPEHRSEYTTLWYQACELEDYTSSDAPYQDRAAKLPELNRLVEKMRSLEGRTKAYLHTDWLKIRKFPDCRIISFKRLRPGDPGIPPTRPTRETTGDTCPACGQYQWWRKNEPGSKWICGRCHPPASGLDVLWMNKR